jgi:glyoxylase-like metal-dependent hydrolase (beta-lactamase superfamily II)
MIVTTLALGPVQTNCYLVADEHTRQAVVIDPSWSADLILAEAKSANLTIEMILITHGHFDHVGANRKLKEATGAKLVIHALDQPMLKVLSETSAAFGLSVENSPPPDQTVQDGDSLQFGEITLTVLHTPGHTPGGISLHTDGVVFVGDTLFAGSIGRTDFPGGDFDTLISSIRNKLYPLGDQMIVYTGHGPETTIGREKRFNPFASM